MNAKPVLLVLILCSLPVMSRAQKLDLEQEKKTNALGHMALVCAAIGMVELEEVQPQTKAHEELRKFMIGVSGVGQLAYGSVDVFVWKSTAATFELKEALADKKKRDFGGYAASRAQMSATRQTCVKEFKFAIDGIK
jgi:hypothetical protein